MTVKPRCDFGCGGGRNICWFVDFITSCKYYSTRTGVRQLHDVTCRSPTAKGGERKRTREAAARARAGTEKRQRGTRERANGKGRKKEK